MRKWNISINFFENFYLKSGLDKNKKLIFNEYIDPLDEPKKNFKYYLELIKCKLLNYYLKVIKYKY